MVNLKLFKLNLITHHNKRMGPYGPHSPKKEVVIVMLMTLITLIVITTATLWDISTNRIPNLITLPAIVLGILLNTYYSGLTGLGDALAGSVVGILLLIIPFAFGGMGGGDVKLLAAVGALNGLLMVMYTFLYSAVAGGVIALVVALFKGKLYPVLFNIFWAFRNFPIEIFRGGQQKSLMPITSDIWYPYGLAIFIGTITAYWLR